MITFCPSTDMHEIARVLDDKRLGSTRIEAWSILKWLRAPPDQYTTFRAAGYCQMWKGYETALAQYLNIILMEWERRGKQNITLRPYDPDKGLDVAANDASPVLPPWWGHPYLHAYHRHALMAKLPSHYRQFGWTEDGSAYNGSYPWPRQIQDSVWVLRWPKAKGLDDIPVSGTASKESVLYHNQKALPATPAPPTTSRKRASSQRTASSPSPKQTKATHTSVVTPEPCTRTQPSQAVRRSKRLRQGLIC